MKRNLKALGLALVAAFAISSLVASAAQATSQGKFTAAKYPAVFTGSQDATATNAFTITAGNGQTTCKIATYEGTLTEASTKITVTPHYTECTSSGLAATIHLNGCHYIFEAGTWTQADNVTHGSAQIVCPAGKQIQITAGPCIVDVYPQTVPNGGVTFTNLPIGGGTNAPYVVAHVALKGIEYTETDANFFCPNASPHHTKDGEFHSTVTLKGYEDTGNSADPGTPGTLDYTHGVTEIGIDVK